jgi:hypothetical protein
LIESTPTPTCASQTATIAPQQPAAFSGMPALESGKTLADYWRIVRRHRWSIILLTILGMLIGLSGGNEIPVFRSQLTMVVEPDFPT